MSVCTFQALNSGTFIFWCALRMVKVTGAMKLVCVSCLWVVCLRLKGSLVVVVVVVFSYFYF